MDQPAAPSLRLPPELMPELIEEILLRIPPEDIAYLVSFTLVSRDWQRNVWSASFARQYRSLHPTQPALVGFFQNLRFGDRKDYVERFVTAVPDSPLVRPDRHILGSLDVDMFLSPDPDPEPAPIHVVDCRHGMALLKMADGSLCVWEPVSNRHRLLPEVPFEFSSSSAAVLCSVPDCDHRLCRRHRQEEGLEQEEFKVVFIGSLYCEHHTVTKVSMYSSATGTWTPPVTNLSPLKAYYSIFDEDEVRPSRLFDGGVFFIVEGGLRVLRYDLAQGTLSVLPPPFGARHAESRLLFIGDSGTRLGFAAIVQDAELRMWSWQSERAEWIEWDYISLKSLRRNRSNKRGGVRLLKSDHRCMALNGFSEETKEFFISTSLHIYMVDVEAVTSDDLFLTMPNGFQMKQLCAYGNHRPVFPYVCY